MDPADQDTVRCTLEAQGKLLGKHDQLLSDLWTLLQILNARETNLLTSGQAEQVGAKSRPSAGASSAHSGVVFW